MIKTPTAARTLSRVEESLSQHGRIVLCHIVRSQGSTPGKTGWKLIAHPDGSTIGNLGGGAFEALVVRDARSLLESDGESSITRRYYLTEDAVRGVSTGMVCGGFCEVLLEVLEADPVLLICGGGPVGQALATQAAHLDLEIVIAEDRPEFRNRELFPDGTRCLEVGRDYEGAFLKSFAHRELIIAIVTRCWETDVAALCGVLRQSPERLAYLGLMGSDRKVRRVRKEVEQRGLSLASVDLRAPIGLAIGAETPAEIAISILAEVVQAMHRKGAADESMILEAVHADRAT